MIITDSLSNLFSRIKNGSSSKKYKITQPKIKLIMNILNIFLQEGLIKSYQISKKKENTIYIYLKYKNNKPVIQNIQRISKPGKRIYIKNTDLFQKKEGLYLLSTSMGILTDLQARKLNIGGEIICKIF